MTDQPEFIIFWNDSIWDIHPKYRGTVAWGERALGELGMGRLFMVVLSLLGDWPVRVVLTAWNVHGGLCPLILKECFDLKGRNCVIWKVGTVKCVQIGWDTVRAKCSLMAVISLLSLAGYGGKRESHPKNSSGKIDSSSRRRSMAGPSLLRQWREKKREDQPC